MFAFHGLCYLFIWNFVGDKVIVKVPIGSEIWEGSQDSWVLWWLQFCIFLSLRSNQFYPYLMKRVMSFSNTCIALDVLNISLCNLFSYLLFSYFLLFSEEVHYSQVIKYAIRSIKSLRYMMHQIHPINALEVVKVLNVCRIRNALKPKVLLLMKLLITNVTNRYVNIFVTHHIIAFCLWFISSFWF